MNNEIIAGFDDERNEGLKIELEKVNEQCLILHLTGYIDTYNSIFFQSHVGKAIAKNFIQLIFECSELTYLSSAGIAVFLALLKPIKPRGGNAVLVNINSKIHDLFKLLGFAQFFPIKNTVNEALEFLSNIPKPSKNVFPVVLNCPICGRKLDITRPGRFRCAVCQTILAISNNAQIFLG